MVTPPFATPPQAAESKRRGQLEEFQRKRHYKNTREMEEWERRKMSRESEARKRAHEDRIKQLVVSEVGIKQLVVREVRIKQLVVREVEDQATGGKGGGGILWEGGGHSDECVQFGIHNLSIPSSSLTHTPHTHPPLSHLHTSHTSLLPLPPACGGPTGEY